MTVTSKLPSKYRKKQGDRKETEKRREGRILLGRWQRLGDRRRTHACGNEVFSRKLERRWKKTEKNEKKITRSAGSVHLSPRIQALPTAPRGRSTAHRGGGPWKAHTGAARTTSVRHYLTRRTPWAEPRARGQRWKSSGRAGRKEVWAECVRNRERDVCECVYAHAHLYAFA